jgi:hypothetical protein
MLRVAPSAVTSKNRFLRVIEKSRKRGRQSTFVEELKSPEILRLRSLNLSCTNSESQKEDVICVKTWEW